MEVRYMSTSFVSQFTPDRETPASRTADGTLRLLPAGIAAGPFYLVVGLLQALTRPGFDLRKHELSQLALGDWGWIQTANFLISGLLVIVAAIGMRRVFQTGPGRIWAPILVALYGVGLIGAGIFQADAGLGFPPGTPSNEITISGHGMLHLASAAIGFLSLIAACFVVGRRQLALRSPQPATYSMATGAVFLVSFLGGVIVSGNPDAHGVVTLLLWISVGVGWLWLTITSWRLMRAR